MVRNLELLNIQETEPFSSLFWVLKHFYSGTSILNFFLPGIISIHNAEILTCPWHWLNRHHFTPRLSRSPACVAWRFIRRSVRVSHSCRDRLIKPLWLVCDCTVSGMRKKPEMYLSWGLSWVWRDLHFTQARRSEKKKRKEIEQKVVYLSAVQRLSERPAAQPGSVGWQEEPEAWRTV